MFVLASFFKDEIDNCLYLCRSYFRDRFYKANLDVPLVQLDHFKVIYIRFIFVQLVNMTNGYNHLHAS